MTPERHRALLGRIAGSGLFNISEPLATMALAILLEDPVLRDALLRRAEQITGADLHSVTWFHAEHIQDDLGRPDLVGIDAKLDHAWLWRPSSGRTSTRGRCVRTWTTWSG